MNVVPSNKIRRRGIEMEGFEMQWMCAYCKCYYVSKEIFKEHKKIKHGKNSEFGYWKELRKKSKKRKLKLTISTAIDKIHSDTEGDNDDDSITNFQDIKNPEEEEDKGTGKRKEKDKDQAENKGHIQFIDLVDSDDDDNRIDDSNSDDEPPPILTKMTELKNDLHSNYEQCTNRQLVNNENQEKRRGQITMNSDNIRQQEVKEIDIEMKNSADEAGDLESRIVIDASFQRKKDKSNYEETKNSSKIIQNNNLFSCLSNSTREFLHVQLQQKDLQLHQAQGKNYSDDSGYIDCYENLIAKEDEKHLKSSKAIWTSSSFSTPLYDNNDNNILQGNQSQDSISTSNNEISHHSNLKRKNNFPCHICSKLFKSSKWLENHISRVHMGSDLSVENFNTNFNSSSSINTNSHTTTDRDDDDVQIIKVHPPALIPSTARTKKLQDQDKFSQATSATSTSVIVKNNHKPKPKSYFQYQYEKHDHKNYALLHYEQVLKNTKRRQLRQSKKDRIGFKILKKIFIQNSVRVDNVSSNLVKYHQISTNSVDLIIEEVIRSVSKRSSSLKDQSFKRQKSF